MTSTADRSPSRPRRNPRWTQLSLRLTVVLVAAFAVSLCGYRQWKGYHTVTTVIYPVRDLVTGDREASYQPLIDEITTSVQPNSWAGRGGTGAVTPFFLDRTLIVRNNLVAHEQITAALHEKRVSPEIR